MSQEIIDRLDQLAAGQSQILEAVDGGGTITIPGPGADGGFSEPDEEGFVRCGLVDQYYENAQREGDRAVKLALQHQDRPELFLLPDKVQTREQLVNISENSYRWRLILRSDGKFFHDYIDFAPAPPGRALGAATPTLKKVSGNQPMKFSRYTRFDPVTGAGVEWELNDNANIYTPEDCLQHAVKWLRQQAKRHTDEEPKVDFSPSDRL